VFKIYLQKVYGRKEIFSYHHLFSCTTCTLASLPLNDTTKSFLCKHFAS